MLLFPFITVNERKISSITISAIVLTTPEIWAFIFTDMMLVMLPDIHCYDEPSQHYSTD